MMTFNPRSIAVETYSSKSMRIAMGGNHPGFAADAEFGQGISGGFHDRPVGVAAHQNSHERFGG